MSDRAAEFIERKRQRLAKKLETKRIARATPAPDQVSSDPAASKILLDRIEELEQERIRLTARVIQLERENADLRQAAKRSDPADEETAPEA